MQTIFLSTSIIVLPLIIAPIVYFSYQKKSSFLLKILILCPLAIAFLNVLILFPIILRHKLVAFRFDFIFPHGISIYINELSLIMGFITTTLWLLVTFYSFDYMAGKNNLNRYYSFLLVSFTGCVGVAFAGNLLTQFLFFEIASLVPYILIIHDGKPHTITAANKYLYMCLMASLALFFSVVYTYFLTDTLEFAELKNLAKQGIVLPTSIFVSFILGYATKAGLFPLHIWLPDAYPVAPSPFGSLSSGIMIKVGIFGIFKLFFEIYDFNLINQLGWGTVLQVIAGITILLGSAMALNEKNLKKLLAYSSISQMGYILLGTSLLNNRALLGAVFHLFSHSFAKGTLFLCAGAIKQKTGNLNIDNMKGLGYKMPITMACFTISALSMIGIPPLSGFVSKWYLGLGCLDASMPLYLIILLVSSLMNAIYFLPITINAFFTSETQKKFTINEVPFKMLFSIVSLTFGTILGGVFRTPILILAKTAAKKLLI